MITATLPDGIFYYAMEYLDGLNLHELVQRYGAQPEARVVHILRQICESLSEAHGVGLIHRDIKPANVFLCDRGGIPDSVKVLDFGLVKHVSDQADELTAREMPGADGIVGTPNFIAPEAIRDSNRSDARSDLYSLGALGYFLLTGREVFEGDSIAELCAGKHLHGNTRVARRARRETFRSAIGSAPDALLGERPRRPAAIRPRTRTVAVRLTRWRNDGLPNAAPPGGPSIANPSPASPSSHRQILRRSIRL